ncbi:MAG: FixH family protein [Rhizomicrobium sp.]
MTRTWTGYHILTTLIATFAVVLAVNVLFIVKAYTTFSGEDEQKPYMQGIEYNETLERHALQARLGWKATLDATRNGQSGARILVSLFDHSGAPISNLSLTALLKHPSDEAKDREIPLHPVSTGVYEGDGVGIQPGAWDLSVSATQAPSTPFEAIRRVWIR